MLQQTKSLDTVIDLLSQPSCPQEDGKYFTWTGPDPTQVNFTVPEHQRQKNSGLHCPSTVVARNISQFYVHPVTHPEPISQDPLTSCLGPCPFTGRIYPLWKSSHAGLHHWSPSTRVHPPLYITTISQVLHCGKERRRFQAPHRVSRVKAVHHQI